MQSVNGAGIPNEKTGWRDGQEQLGHFSSAVSAPVQIWAQAASTKRHKEFERQSLFWILNFRIGKESLKEGFLPEGHLSQKNGCV